MSHLFSCCTFCALFSCCTFFVLYSFRVALFPFYTFFMLNSFHVALFSCCTFCALFSCCTFFMLNSFHVALFSSCTVLMLHLFVCCTPFLFHLFLCCLMLYFLSIQTSNFIKKRLHHRCLSVEFGKFYLGTPILENICEDDCFQKLSLINSFNVKVSQHSYGSFRLEACSFIKKRVWGRCFPVNFTKFLRKPFFTKHLRWLLLSDFSSFRMQIYL